MKPSLLFKESAGKALIPIERTNGADGKVELEWKTEDMTAKSGKDFEGGSGTIVFDHGEMTKMLEITIFDDQVRSVSRRASVDQVSWMKKFVTLSVLFLRRKRRMNASKWILSSALKAPNWVALEKQLSPLLMMMVGS